MLARLSLVKPGLTDMRGMARYEVAAPMALSLQVGGGTQSGSPILEAANSLMSLLQAKLE